MEIVLSVLVAILSIALIVVVLMQDGKDQGLGALAGNADSYLNKTGKDGKSIIAASTKWIALAWLLVILGLSLI
jgi:preprotein translocase subunit SecG